ncbi:hypothetical protein I4U23_030783 [Adineta vaga]|nr:hypothetical protein I4U23_030783 [Adineta vaga]
MSTILASTLVYISQKFTTYIGSCIFFLGIAGNLLNIVVFLSLQTFRSKACALYLTVMSFVNIGNLCTGLLSRIIISGFAIDWTLISSFYCKFRWYALQFCVLTSFACTCLAIIDQYLATSFHLRYRNWSNIKTAQYLTILVLLLLIFHGIFYLIYFDLIRSSTTNRIVCTSENNLFRQYHLYGYLITLAGILPLIITSCFGILAYYNVKNLAYRTVPLVRRHLDKQLTSMVLVQIVLNFIFTLPYTILTTISSVLVITNVNEQAVFDFSNVMAILLYYLSFSCPFYIYVCTSARFRQQLSHVLFQVYLERWRRARPIINQIVPAT